MEIFMFQSVPAASHPTAVHLHAESDCFFSLSFHQGFVGSSRASPAAFSSPGWINPVLSVAPSRPHSSATQPPCRSQPCEQQPWQLCPSCLWSSDKQVVECIGRRANWMYGPLLDQPALTKKLMALKFYIKSCIYFWWEKWKLVPLAVRKQ